jgi:DUF4097 and DUF4098 domain-containing protein YvlB
LWAVAEERNEFSYKVGPGAVISITNNCGPIMVKPSGSDQVLVTTVSHSSSVRFVSEQVGGRVQLLAESILQGTDLADYTVSVPADAVVRVRSSNGAIRAQGLSGDVIVEAATGSVEVTGISGAHLHVKSFSAPVTLNDVRNSRVDVHSVSGDINLHNVSGPWVEVHSASGRISYDGDPGTSGDYLLTTHSGDLEVSIPAAASAEIKAHSLQGQSDLGSIRAPDFLPNTQRKLLKPGLVSGSRFVLRSFKGKIDLKRP